MKRNNTKRTLVLSLISILLCFTMLIGSTFAWFTDTASTAVNKIQSGTLDVGLKYRIQGYEWGDAEGQTLQWLRACTNGTGLWEPGCTYKLPDVQVVNKGSLALKYKIYINGVEGDAKLLEVIDFTVTMDGQTLPLNGFEGHLLPGEGTKAITISGHMREEAGNEYQGQTIDGIGITVVATQYNWECDSYGHDYDAEAPLPEPVSTPEELAAALNSSETESIVITEDLADDAEGYIHLPTNDNGTSGDFATIPEGTKKIIDLNGHTLKFKTQSVTANGNYAVIDNSGELILTGDKDNPGTIELTHDGTDMQWNALSAVILNHGSGKLNIGEGVNIKHNGGTMMAYAVDIIANEGSPVTNITGGTLESTYVGIRMFNTSTETSGTLNISGGTITAPSRGIWLQHFGGPAYLNITGGKIESNGHGVYVDGCQTNADNLARESTKIIVNITGGELISHMSARQDSENNVMCIGALSVYRGSADGYADKITLNVDENLLINTDGGFSYVIFKGNYEPIYTVPEIETTEP